MSFTNGDSAATLASGSALELSMVAMFLRARVWMSWKAFSCACSCFTRVAIRFVFSVV